eukprot:2793754-Pyramimonas_sp.AAC.1
MIAYWDGGRGALNKLSAVCAGPARRFSGRRHQVLEGRAPGGRLWTQVAEPYPPRLLSLWSQCAHGA